MTVALSLLTTSSLVAPNKTNAQETAQTDAEDLTVIKVQAERLPVSSTGAAEAVVRVTQEQALRLDSILTSLPGTSLFRRADSKSAHPTTQGMTIRGVGANAAGRVLVTLDGIPQNDPFGGWVYWSSFSRYLEGARVFKGGAPGAYGAQALAGAVEIVPGGARTDSELNGSLAADGSIMVEGQVAFELGDTSNITLDGGYQELDGFHLFSKEQRGPVDVEAESDTAFANFAMDTRLGSAVLQTRLRWHKENRVNGLSLATNQSENRQVSMRLLSGVPDAAEGNGWEIALYYRDRDFENLFVSARDDRTTERPVLDQFDVPAWGAGFLARVQTGALEFGADGRRMSGETNERFRNLGAGFTRQRRAGGDQWVLGLFTEYGATHGDTNISATLRADRWKTYNGARVETNIADGSLVREDTIENRADWIWSGRLGFEQPLTGAIDLRGAAYKSWRLPTLNEYYRPFRVVNDITEANPNLRPEKLYGLEIGFDYQPLNTVSLSTTYFRNWLEDGVGNITIGFGPGFFELGGFVPAGGVLRQRANIDRSITDGFELDGELQLQTGWTLGASYLYSKARVTQFEARPELVGKRPVQTPRHSMTLRAAYDAGGKLTARTEMRVTSGQYDDDLNERRLEGIVTFNAAASYRISNKVAVTANVENLFDAKVVSAVTADGLETLAQRRFARIGLDINF